ncbi:recombinase family protein [Vibrio sp. B172a]|uniref:recombinase family protein n=1 Tax=Vibrio sp. B172a TaxID=2835790 RepID=UPI0025536366|nr:recombinase family protein [Vibrio sp. B172a]
MFIRAYLRASTIDQDADRAKNELQTFASEHNVRIASFYTEQLSGTKLERTELARLIEDSHRGDVLLIEKVDVYLAYPMNSGKNSNNNSSKQVSISSFSINQ